MPADHALPERTERHGDASRPYTCHARPKPPGAEFAIDYGYCRHSLDTLVGHTDPRCPADCRHKAPPMIVLQFEKLFRWHGARGAAEFARRQRSGR